MEAEALEALKASIAKWEAIAAGTGMDHGADNCHLCMTFPGCEGCPVAEDAGEPDCCGTPWEDWYAENVRMERRSLSRGWLADSDKLKELARAELDFLKSLLPFTENP